jgi:hypothetical protein
MTSLSKSELEVALLSLPRITRKDIEQLTCISFGANRLEVYPHGWFCKKCDDFQSLLPKQQENNKGMKKYKCLASRHRHSLPQQRQAGYFLGTTVK